MNPSIATRQQFILPLLTLLATITLSCQEDSVFEQSPAERSARAIRELRSELTRASEGWRVTYFPKTDSLIFSNRSELLQTHIYQGKYGVGGFCFWMNFDEEGTVNILADFDENSMKQVRKSEFEVRQNTFTQLSFTTYSYLHDKVNELFSASSDFLYLGKDAEGRLIFRTPSCIEPAREFMVFEKLSDGQVTADPLQKAYAHRLFFEEMKNPQLKIHRGDRVLFQSDYFLKNMNPGMSEENAHNRRWVKKVKEQRYWVFIQDKSLGEGRELYGLGSGYTGTEQGMTFHPGIRYNGQYIFYDFQKVGDKFVCELVNVYDPWIKKYRLTSKHLAPPHAEKEETGMIAEIWDEQINNP